ncbi:MAG: TonB-dependent receptor [Bacteroidetes Order II. Incertae sedis bacterium]|nr:TonB-dependent receptor [Bacteroidetes Order II. bacterium]
MSRSFLLLLVLPNFVFAQTSYSRVKQEPYWAPPSSSLLSPGAVLAGCITDFATGDPVPFVQLLLEELRRTSMTDESGQFVFPNVPSGIYHLKTFRVGYQSIEQPIQVSTQDTVRLTVRLTASINQLGEVEIMGESENKLEKAALAVEGATLRQNLSGTIAETLLGTAGMAMRSMGPAPARPVLRGMGGDRLTVLEDGGRTGDLSASSADHAVVIEPLNAERIEVLRGPVALAYSASALGGVINVVRNFIPTHQPEALHVAASLQGESVNKGISVGYMVGAPIGKIALHTDGSFRTAQDLQTPSGVLKNTDLRTLNGSIGLSSIQKWGHVGVAYSHYNSRYGIPGGFVGAHPNGVRIALYRNHAEFSAEYVPQNAIHLTNITLKNNFTYYFHQEFEASGAIGMEFQTLEVHTKIDAQTKSIGPFQRGKTGISGLYRQYNVGGLVFSPNVTEFAANGYAYQEAKAGPWTLSAGIRYDVRTAIPEKETQTRIGFIRKRDFGGFAASVSINNQVSRRLSMALTFNRSIRMPAIEELFTEGPHLAAYSYDTGNPELITEKGYGAEWSARYRTTGSEAQLTLFRNRIPTYIYLANTGKINNRTLLPVYQYSGGDARLQGFEAMLHQSLFAGLSVTTTLSFVSGTLVEASKPLPQMPPMNGNAAVQYHLGNLRLSGGVKFAVKQDQLGDFEEATNGYVVPNLSAQYHLTTGKKLHTIDLSLNNLTNTIYRDHLSRVKSIMPEPGFNMKLLYRIYF